MERIRLRSTVNTNVILKLYIKIKENMYSIWMSLIIIIT